MTLTRRLILAIALATGLAPALAAPPPPVPALPDSPRLTSYSISGTTCACNVNFALYGDSTDYWHWLEVWINGVRYDHDDASHGWTITSPTGALGSIPLPVTDALLTFNAVQTGTVQIVGARRPRRVSQFSENGGVPARDLNQVITDEIAMLREVWDKVNDFTGRGFFAPPGQTGGIVNGLQQGVIFGPVNPVSGHVAVWNGTTGTSLADGGLAYVVGGALGSPSSVGTMPAFTLGGTISGGGNQINNVNIGNVSPGAGGFTNLFASAVTNLGTTITPQASDVLVLNNNASGVPAQVNGFSPNFRIIGKDGERPPMSIQGFGVGAEPTILLMHARGTGAAPTASQSGDFIGELFAHPCGAGTTPCTYMHDAGAGFIWRMLENATTTAGEAIDVWTTPVGGTAVGLAATFGGDGKFFAANSATIGTASPASGTVRGFTINGAAAGTGAGSSVAGNDGGSIAWSVGSYSAILGGSYDARMLLYSASAGVVTNSSFKSLSPTGGVGYGTGAGGAVTQLTGRTTGVTLNTITGAITLVSAAGTTAFQKFTVTDSAVAATDAIIVNQKSGTDRYQIFVTAIGAGSFDIDYATIAGTTTEQPVFNFAIIKGSAN